MFVRVVRGTPGPVFGLVTALVIALAVAAPVISSASADEDATPPAYTWLLDQHVVAVSGDGDGRDTRFDYQALYLRPDGDERRREVREAFLAVDPGSLAPVERRAWALNAYNFFVVDLVTENLVGEDDAPLNSIADIGEGSFAVFDEERFRVAGRTYSLNSFERHFLFDDFDRASAGDPPAGLDPRLHFALVCAAKGCPPLLAQPFRADELDAQLDRAARNALSLPHHLTRKGPVLLVSKVFEWYAADFGGPEGVRTFLVEYAPESVARAVDEGLIEAVLTDLDWDWSLNRTR